MKKILFPLIFSLLTLPFFSQSLQDNLEAEPAEVAEVAEKNFIEKGVFLEDVQ